MSHYTQDHDVDARKQWDGRDETVKPGARDGVGRSVLALIDPKPLTRESFSFLFRDLSSEFSVLCFSSPEELSSAQSQFNDASLVLLLNIGSSSSDSESVKESITSIRQDFEDEPIILLGELTTAGHILHALYLGVQGYLPTTLSATVAVEAVRLVRAGGTYVPVNAVAEALASLSPGAHDERGVKRQASEGKIDRGAQPTFTVRQLQVIDFLRKGASNKVIAHELSMKESTVKVHVRHIMKKCHATNRTQAALYAEKIA